MNFGGSPFATIAFGAQLAAGVPTRPHAAAGTAIAAFAAFAFGQMAFGASPAGSVTPPGPPAATGVDIGAFGAFAFGEGAFGFSTIVGAPPPPPAIVNAFADPYYDLSDLLPAGVVMTRQINEGLALAYRANGYRPLSQAQIIAVTGPALPPVTSIPADGVEYYNPVDYGNAPDYAQPWRYS